MYATIDTYYSCVQLHTELFSDGGPARLAVEFEGTCFLWYTEVLQFIDIVREKWYSPS